jgi:single-strand DNA-binding protein
MPSFNKVLLMGNLTRDPELRYTPQGTAVANLGLAVNRRFKDKNQEWKEETLFITVITWDRQAETCSQYLRKGRPVFVEGRLQSRSWEDKTGQKRSVIEVRAERIQFLGSPSGAGAAPEQSRPEKTEAEPMQEPSTETAWLSEESEEKTDEV